ncbi:pre-rRNA-processing protein TSR2 homolog [Euwallacea fornicatus]|uniref:pre-rRNA-processing protein TSR2 homolog n=1 Tax=Euwallacea fornicatus TaxID=995702 RepID=UPI00338DF5CF
MEEPFAKVVSQIFNNWTALRLAVDHSMGGPHSKQVAIDFINYMVQFCLSEPHVEAEHIQMAIEDILDEEFDTVCEDDSPKQISQLLYMFLRLLKDGKSEECEFEFQKLPVGDTMWSNEPSKMRPVKKVENEFSSDDTDSDCEEAKTATPMEQDGWVEVKGRKKR